VSSTLAEAERSILVLLLLTRSDNIELYWILLIVQTVFYICFKNVIAFATGPPANAFIIVSQCILYFDTDICEFVHMTINKNPTDTLNAPIKM